MNAGPLYVGIDGGGTSTTLVVVDATGAEIVRHRTGATNPAVIGHAAAAAALAGALTEVAGRCDVEAPFAAAWFGLAGGDRPEDHRRLLPALEPLASSITITNDAELVLGALPDGIGVAVVAGTGSIAIGRDGKGNRARAGGWGHVFADEGSGYDLAIRMLRAIAAAADERCPATSLTPRLLERLNVQEPHQIIPWVYDKNTTKGVLAGLSNLVIEEAEFGDPMAVSILGDAASALADVALAAAAQLDMLGGMSLALTGSLLIHEVDYRERVVGRIAERADIDALELVAEPALTAARALSASNRSGAGDNP